MRLLDGNLCVSQSRVWGRLLSGKGQGSGRRGQAAATRGSPCSEPTRPGSRLLGALLRLRRAALGYRHVPAFAGARGINTRMVGDIEHGRRDTYTLPTLQDVAAAYEVTYDSMMAVVWSGAGELVPAAAEPSPRPRRRAAPPARRADRRRRTASPPTGPTSTAINERRLRASPPRHHRPDRRADVRRRAPDDAKAWDGTARPHARRRPGVVHRGPPPLRRPPVRTAGRLAATRRLTCGCNASGPAGVLYGRRVWRTCMTNITGFPQTLANSAYTAYEQRW